jgi:hypothetical protein
MSLRPLSDVNHGEQVQVVEVVFDAVRRLCPDVELHPGDILDCEARTQRSIAFRRTDGRTVVIDRFYASFIAVQSPGRSSGDRFDPDPSLET